MSEAVEQNTPGTRYTRRAVPPTDKEIRRERLWEWRWGIFTIAFILVFGGSLYVWRYSRLRDAADAPLQTASAVVTGKSVADWRGRAGNGWDIKLRINNRTAVANTSNLMLFSHLNIGDTVTVVYSVGKSGDIYVAELAQQPEQHVVQTSPATR
jgi:hypothetical protein